MKRRALLIAGLALPLCRSALGQTAVPARVSLIDGGWQNGERFAAVAVDLDDGWKTYWRVPGDAGIPPEFKWDGSQNARAIDVLYPLPRRYQDQSGESIGYKYRVVFPVHVTPDDRAVPVELSLAMFFGVCSEVCVPRKVALKVTLPPGGSDQGVAEWLARVPQAASASGPVSNARVEVASNVARLVLALSGTVDDIFVEGAGDSYFHKPQITDTIATMAIDNATPEMLRGASLRLTLVTGADGVEQRISLP